MTKSLTGKYGAGRELILGFRGNVRKKSTKARNRQKWNFSYAQWGRYRKAHARLKEDVAEIKKYL